MRKPHNRHNQKNSYNKTLIKNLQTLFTITLHFIKRTKLSMIDYTVRMLEREKDCYVKVNKRNRSNFKVVHSNQLLIQTTHQRIFN